MSTENRLKTNNSDPKKGTRLQSLILGLFSLLFAALIFEVGSRLVLPVSPGIQDFTLDGEPMITLQDNGRIIPGITFRQVSQEFDVKAAITDAGYRVPEVQGNPDIIFVGDSFTFGDGLTDEETFPFIIARETGLQIANLGNGATGTIEHLDTLEYFLKTYNWQPAKVNLCMLAMSTAFFSGNDFTDNLVYQDSLNQEDKLNTEADFINTVKRKALQNLNSVRVLKFYLGHYIREKLAPEMEAETFNRSKNVMKEQLVRLDEMSNRFGFKYEIFIIHPIQDLKRGTHNETLKTVKSLSSKPELVNSSAESFLEGAENYYYPYDGHFNPAGSRKMADYLLNHSLSTQ